ncbi:MAG TPA: phosphate ABC transporter permease PstA [Acidimicrobiia bacterium]
MTATTDASPPSLLTSGQQSASRKLRNHLATACILATVLIALIPLYFVIAFVVRKGGSTFGWSFLTQDPPIIDQLSGGGMFPAIVGTLIITAGATIMAVPLGILGAIYLNEYGQHSRLARVLRFLSEIMLGVPSIVMGLFIFTVITLHFKTLNGFAGSLALACLILPIVIRTSEEMLHLVPDELREGSYALGSRRVRTIRTVVLPNAAPGIVSGSLLAVARAAGETAPLLFVIGTVTSANHNLFSGPNTTLSVQIFHGATSPFVGAQNRAYAAALTLVLLTFVFTGLARLVTTIYARRSTAGA